MVAVVKKDLLYYVLSMFNMGDVLISLRLVFRFTTQYLFQFSAVEYSPVTNGYFYQG